MNGFSMVFVLKMKCASKWDPDGPREKLRELPKIDVLALLLGLLPHAGVIFPLFWAHIFEKLWEKGTREHVDALFSSFSSGFSSAKFRQVLRLNFMLSDSTSITPKRATSLPKKTLRIPSTTDTHV